MSNNISSPRNAGKPPVCRIASLAGFGGVLIGRDIAGIFEEGHVYRITKVFGVIGVEDLGPHAVEPSLRGADLNAHHTSGIFCLTQPEYDREKEMKNYG